jgi:hypothetical protein
MKACIDVRLSTFSHLFLVANHRVRKAQEVSFFFWIHACRLLFVAGLV